MKIVNLEQRTDEWKQWRRQGITATDAVVLAGSPYKTPWRLWMEKTGKALEEDLSANPRVRYGIEHEDDARTLFEKKFGMPVMPACGESDENPILRASFDGLTMADEPVEIKCPSRSVLEEVKLLGRASSAYRHYYPQVQYQMLVSGARRGWLVFYDGDEEGGAPSILDFEVRRDSTFLDDLKAKCLAFYDDIVNRKEPAKDNERDLFVPSADQAGEWLAAAKQYLCIQQEIDRYAAQIDELKKLQSVSQEALKRIMGNHCVADFGGIAITRSVVRGKVDYAALTASLAGRKPTEEEMEKFRGKPSERWLFRATEQVMPKDINDPELEELAETAEAEDDFPAIYL